MTDRPRRITMIGMLLLIILIALISGAPKALVNASFEMTAKANNTAMGPSQFYAQHNLVSDVPGLADHRFQPGQRLGTGRRSHNTLVDC